LETATGARQVTAVTDALLFFPGFTPRQNPGRSSGGAIDASGRSLLQGGNRRLATRVEARAIERLRIGEVRRRHVESDEKIASVRSGNSRSLSFRISFTVPRCRCC